MLAACHQPPTGPQATAVVPDAPPEPPPPPPVACPLRAGRAGRDAVRRRAARPSWRWMTRDVSTSRCSGTGPARRSWTRRAASRAATGYAAEWAPRDQVWTPHERWLWPAIASCSRTTARSASRPMAGWNFARPTWLTCGRWVSMQIRGYREEARCAGLVLLATFMSMTPSMAAVDGHPARAPAPEGSRCTS